MFCVRNFLLLLLIVTLSACVPAGPSIKEKKAQQADVHYKLGMSYLKGKDPTMALKELLIAVENGPDNAAIHAALAQAYQSKRAYSQAEQHYIKALVFSDNEPLYQNNLASLYLEIKQWDKAIDLFGKAASNLLFSQAHISLTGKGYAYFMKQDFPAALKQYKEAIAMAPRYPVAYFRESEAYAAMEQNELAIDALKKAVEIAPGFTLALYQLGVMELKAQQLVDASNRFARIIELEPASELGKKAEEMLRSLETDESANVEEDKAGTTE